jgi:hypothetical protein
MTKTMRMTGVLMFAAMMMASEANAQESGGEVEAQALTAEQGLEGDASSRAGVLESLGGKLKLFYAGLLSRLGDAREKIEAYVSGERGDERQVGRDREQDPRGNAFGLRSERDDQRPGKRVARGLVRGEDGRPAHAKAGGRGLSASEPDKDAAEAEPEGRAQGKRLGQIKGQGFSHANGRGRRNAAD